jgi:hypothetical protein
MREIDFVFLWVDPADPAWQKRRDDFLQAHPQTPADSFLPIHFADHDELRYAIRSVEKFAPFFRKIFLITDRQRPAWLKDDARLELVDHRAFFAPDSANPVFSPHPIESQLHRIPGLAEHFVYSNDDTLLGRPVTPEDFFRPDGTIIVRMTAERVRTPRPEDIKWRWVWYNAVRAIERKIGTFYRPFRRGLLPFRRRRTDLPWNHLDHQMFALRKSVCAGAEAFFTDEFRFIRAQQYRSRQGIAPLALFYYWAIHAGLARPVAARESLYIDTPRLDGAFRRKLARLRLPANKRPKFLCLNDNAPAETAAEIYAAALQALAGLLPAPSFCEDSVPAAEIAR